MIGDEIDEGLYQATKKVKPREKVNTATEQLKNLWFQRLENCN